MVCIPDSTDKQRFPPTMFLARRKKWFNYHVLHDFTIRFVELLRSYTEKHCYVCRHEPWKAPLLVKPHAELIVEPQPT